jgi:lipopolysaccharide transport protein LptA/LPS export ABC transporter protein LptC
MSQPWKWKSLVFSASLLWIVGIIVWPNPTNIRLDHGNDLKNAAAGEGLYKSELTEAGFGLLGVRFFESTAGKPSWNIRSEFAELHRKQGNYAFMKKVTADFFAGQSGNTIHTISDYGRSHFDTRVVELEGNVVVRSHQGYRFTMNRLDYEGGPRRFRTNDAVEMAGPDVENPSIYLNGVGLDALLDAERFTFKKNTKARRRLSNNEWIRIQSRSGDFTPTSERATFSGNVKAVLPQLQVESDRLEMSVGSAQGEVLKADGHVVLYHKNRRATSKRADIEIANDKVILEGDASIVADDNELKGRRITLYTDEDRVEVEQAEGNL